MSFSNDYNYTRFSSNMFALKRKFRKFRNIKISNLTISPREAEEALSQREEALESMRCYQQQCDSLRGENTAQETRIAGLTDTVSCSRSRV